jgi:hypothetical protein
MCSWNQSVGLPGCWLVALMTDRYPLFRLDQGSVDSEGPA